MPTNDKFVLHAIRPPKAADKTTILMRVSGRTYDRIMDLKLRTGLSCHLLIDKALDFALERLEIKGVE